jgi:FdhD protein
MCPWSGRSRCSSIWTEGKASVVTRAGAGPNSQRAHSDLLCIGDSIGTEEGGLVTPGEVLAHAPLPPARLARSTLLSLLKAIPEDEAIYRAAGSVHGCALFCGATLWLSIEDVSRRNAIDIVTG